MHVNTEIIESTASTSGVSIVYIPNISAAVVIIDPVMKYCTVFCLFGYNSKRVSFIYTCSVPDATDSGIGCK